MNWVVWSASGQSPLRSLRYELAANALDSEQQPLGYNQFNPHARHRLEENCGQQHTNRLAASSHNSFSIQSALRALYLFLRRTALSLETPHKVMYTKVVDKTTY